MSIAVKELRESTGLTQKEFAAMYDIPLSTLRKWEQGDFTEMKKQNLALYLTDLFEGFYEIKDCKYDKEEDILWS